MITDTLITITVQKVWTIESIYNTQPLTCHCFYNLYLFVSAIACHSSFYFVGKVCLPIYLLYLSTRLFRQVGLAGTRHLFEDSPCPPRHTC